MTQIMTPSSPITDGQIDKAVGHYRDLLKEHRDEIGSSEIVQQVLGQPGYLADLLGVVRKYVGAVSNLTLRRVMVNRMRTPQAALDATRRLQYTNQSVVDAMPRGEGDEAEVIFFKLDASRYKNGIISPAEVAKQYEIRGFKPDPYATAAVNEADPEFATEHPNAVQWQDADGDWCFATFSWWLGVRRVHVHRLRSVWFAYWEFSGVSK